MLNHGTMEAGVSAKAAKPRRSGRNKIPVREKFNNYYQPLTEVQGVARNEKQAPGIFTMDEKSVATPRKKKRRQRQGGKRKRLCSCRDTTKWCLYTKGEGQTDHLIPINKVHLSSLKTGEQPIQPIQLEGKLDEERVSVLKIQVPPITLSLEECWSCMAGSYPHPPRVQNSLKLG